MGEQSTRSMWCDVCELGTGPVQNDIAETDEDTELPPGWVVVEARRVVNSTDFKEATLARYQAVEQHMAQRVNAALSIGGGDLNETQISALRDAARGEAEVAIGDLDMAPFAVEYITGHLCPEHAIKLQALDMDNWDA
jgi:hypothetical protein